MEDLREEASYPQKKKESKMTDTKETDVKAFAKEMADHILKSLGQEENPLAVLIPSYLEIKLESYRIMKDMDRTIEATRRLRNEL